MKADGTDARHGGKILFLEQFYFPEGWGGAELPQQLTRFLAEKGHEVEVICGADQYAKVEGVGTPDPRSSGVKITRVPRIAGGEFKRRKLLRQIWFYVAAVPLLLVRRRPTMLIQQTNPPLMVVIAALASLLWRRPLVIIAMDLYPEVLFASGSLRESGPIAGLLSRVFSWAYCRAAAVVSLGPVMTRRLCDKGLPRSRIVEIHNWSTGADGIDRSGGLAIRRQWGLPGGFVVLYSGNLGVAHEFETFLEGFSIAVRGGVQMTLVIVGRGSRLDEVRALVARFGIGSHVHFAGFVPGTMLPQIMGMADLALVTLRPGFEGVVVPSKLYGLLSRGLPVLYVGPDSDASILLRDTGAGIVHDNGDAAGLAETLRRVAGDPRAISRLGDRGKAAYEARYTAAHALEQYALLVRRIVGGG